ncbi:MAG: HEPN domain-containing protein [Euryarchaeota archaeon]|nr:HEPN domain-containing protein [Euryarchaeota archaeon]
MDEYAEDELEKANDALSDARKLRDVGGTDEAVINRLYYACFHAAQSVLHTRGFDPTTHGGVLTLFGREIVSEGDATGDDGRFLNELQSYRLSADYEHTGIEADIDEFSSERRNKSTI